MDGGAWWAAVHRFAKSQAQLSDSTFTFHFHALEKEMATHSSVIAWRIPGKGEPGGLPSMGLHRVGHDWSDLAAGAAVDHLSWTKKFTRNRYLNRQVTRSEIESVKKKKKSQSLNSFAGEFYQTCTKELVPILLKLFQRLKSLQNHSVKPLLPKPKRLPKKFIGQYLWW